MPFSERYRIVTQEPGKVVPLGREQLIYHSIKKQERQKLFLQGVQKGKVLAFPFFFDETI